MKKIISFSFLFFTFTLLTNAQIIGTKIGSSTVTGIEYARPETTAVGFQTKDRFHYVEFCRKITAPVNYTTGENVTILQTILRYQVYPSLKSTGYYGPLTKRAVQIFQQTYGIRQTGYVGPITLAKMREVWCNFNYLLEADPIPTPTPPPQPPAPKPKPIVSSFEVSRTAIQPGEAVTLSWKSINATKCKLTSSKGDSITTLPSGTRTVNPTSDITYTLTCSNATDNSDPSSRTITAKFNSSTISVTPPNITINYGSSTNLILTTTNMNNCNLNGGNYVNTNVEVNSTTPAIPTKSTTYIFNCIGKDGQAYTAQSKVEVDLSNVLPKFITFSPKPGSYTTDQSVTITGVNTNYIRYTTNNTNPTCTTGTMYSSSTPILVSTTQTIKAIGCNNLGESQVVSGLYNILKPQLPQFEYVGVKEKATGWFSMPQIILQLLRITSLNSSKIYYTLDGSEPSCVASSTTKLYTNPLELNFGVVKVNPGSNGLYTMYCARAEPYLEVHPLGWCKYPLTDSVSNYQIKAIGCDDVGNKSAVVTSPVYTWETLSDVKLGYINIQ